MLSAWTLKEIVGLNLDWAIVLCFGKTVVCESASLHLGV